MAALARAHPMASSTAAPKDQGASFIMPGENGVPPDGVSCRMNRVQYTALPARKRVANTKYAILTKDHPPADPSPSRTNKTSISFVCGTNNSIATNIAVSAIAINALARTLQVVTINLLRTFLAPYSAIGFSPDMAPPHTQTKNPSCTPRHPTSPRTGRYAALPPTAVSGCLRSTAKQIAPSGSGRCRCARRHRCPTRCC